MKKILIVDDEKSILELLINAFQDEYEVVTSINPLHVVEKLLKNPVDLIILDINMPQMNGHQLCSVIRSHKEFESLPMIFMTGINESFVRTVCYQVGGDCIINKPFRIEEIRALVERYLKKNSQTTSILSYGEITLHLLTHKVFICSEEVELGPKEYQILMHFLQHPDELITREYILNKIWKDKLDVSDRTIDTHISKMRKKINKSSCQIKSVYQEGYIFTHADKKKDE